MKFTRKERYAMDHITLDLESPNVHFKEFLLVNYSDQGFSGHDIAFGAKNGGVYPAADFKQGAFHVDPQAAYVEFNYSVEEKESENSSRTQFGSTGKFFPNGEIYDAERVNAEYAAERSALLIDYMETAHLTHLVKVPTPKEDLKGVLLFPFNEDDVVLTGENGKWNMTFHPLQENKPKYFE